MSDETSSYALERLSELPPGSYRFDCEPSSRGMQWTIFDTRGTSVSKGSLVDPLPENNSIMTTPNIRTEFKRILRQHGFKPLTAIVFVREHDPVTSLISLQQSRFDEVFFINVGVMHSGIQDALFSASKGIWHMSARLDKLAPNGAGLRDALNLNSEMKDDARLAEISSALEYIESVLRAQWESEEWLLLKAREPFDPVAPTSGALRRLAGATTGV